jgi:hypothetical protein
VIVSDFCKKRRVYSNKRITLIVGAGAWNTEVLVKENGVSISVIVQQKQL